MPVAKKKAGRPKKAPGEARQNTITISLTDQELAEVEHFRKAQPVLPTRAAVALAGTVALVRGEKRGKP